MEKDFFKELRELSKTLDSAIWTVEEAKEKSQHTKVIKLGYHSENNKECFADAIDCLSQALEGVDISLKNYPWFQEKLKDKIYDAIVWGERFEAGLFDREKD